MTGLKKNQGYSTDEKRGLIERTNNRITVNRQCELMELARSSYYYSPVKTDKKDNNLMRLIDKQYTKTPFYGIRRITKTAQNMGYVVNHKRIARLMRVMGIEAIYPKPRLSKSNKESRKYPYLLRGLSIEWPNQVWSTDITYIGLLNGFVYLAAIMDWYSRYVVSWALSNTLDSFFCVEMLEKALKSTKPEIFNSDQGTQFTSEDFTGILKKHQIRISMDSRGRAYDNIFVERLWRTVKYEEIYLKEYDNIREVKDSLQSYFSFYNNDRPHQSLGYRTPKEIYFCANNQSFEGGKGLIASPVKITNYEVLPEILCHAPSEQNILILHLNR